MKHYPGPSWFGINPQRDDLAVLVLTMVVCILWVGLADKSCLRRYAPVTAHFRINSNDIGRYHDI